MSYQALQKASGTGDDDQQLPHQLVNELHLLALRTLLSLLERRQKPGVYRWPQMMTLRRELPRTHISEHLLKLLLQLHEVAGGDESSLGLGQAVTGQLDDLVVDEAQHPVCQRQSAARREVCDGVLQTFFHLGGGLQGRMDGDAQEHVPPYHVLGLASQDLILPPLALGLVNWDLMLPPPTAPVSMWTSWPHLEPSFQQAGRAPPESPETGVSTRAFWSRCCQEAKEALTCSSSLVPAVTLGNRSL